MGDTSVILVPKKAKAEGARVQASSRSLVRPWNLPTNQLTKKIKRARPDDSGLKSKLLRKLKQDGKFRACLGYRESSRPAWETAQLFFKTKCK